MKKPKDVDGCFDASNCSTAIKVLELLRNGLEKSETTARARAANMEGWIRSQSFCPDMGEFSRGYQTACDEILERCKPYRRIQAGRMTIEHLAKRLADVERWIERREDYESEQREQS